MTWLVHWPTATAAAPLPGDVTRTRQSHCPSRRSTRTWSLRIWRVPRRATASDGSVGLEKSNGFGANNSNNSGLAYPIGSMYAIYGNIYHTPNVSIYIYTIHKSYGLYLLCFIQMYSQSVSRFFFRLGKQQRHTWISANLWKAVETWISMDINGLVPTS